LAAPRRSPARCWQPLSPAWRPAPFSTARLARVHACVRARPRAVLHMPFLALKRRVPAVRLPRAAGRAPSVLPCATLQTRPAIFQGWLLALRSGLQVRWCSGFAALPAAAGCVPRLVLRSNAALSKVAAGWAWAQHAASVAGNAACHGGPPARVVLPSQRHALARSLRTHPLGDFIIARLE
jgi:hypothetical protein